MKQAKGLVHTTHTMIQIIQFRFQKVYVKRVTYRFVEYIYNVSQNVVTSLFIILIYQHTGQDTGTRARTRLTKKLASPLGSFFSLQPERAGFLEQGHKLPREVESHGPVGPADEHRRHGGHAAAAEHPGELPLHLAAAGVPVQLVHGGVHAQVTQQRRHGVAHAAVCSW
jgi:hypothetical protein